MDFLILKELILLQFQSYIKHPQDFVKLFNSAKNLAALDYNLTTRKPDRISQSFKNILGLKKIPDLDNAVFCSRKVHPGDLENYLFLFNEIPSYFQYNKGLPKKISIFKCRIKHSKGYWKNLLVISFVYIGLADNQFHKMIIIADKSAQQYLKQKKNSNFQFLENRSSDHGFEFTTGISKNRNDKEISISSRELDVLQLLSEGLIAKQIARKLSISTTTVISHKKNLISKFDVKNSVELVKYASHLMLV